MAFPDDLDSFTRPIAGEPRWQEPDEVGLWDEIQTAVEAIEEYVLEGIPASTISAIDVQASENIAAGDFVNVHNSSGARVRKADATTAGKEAHGFCLAAILSGASGSVYFEGSNTAVSGQTPGPVYLLTTAGTAGATAPSASGNAVQRLGVATSATSINFEPHPHVVLA